MRTSSSFSPARNVMSTTRPLLSSLSLVRTKAPPLPGLTCWNSTIDPQLVVVADAHAVLEVVRGDCHASRAFRLVARAVADVSIERPSATWREQRATPPSSTTTRSSILTPPKPGTYTPGSMVMTEPVRTRIAGSRGRPPGSSWTSSPTPCPSPCAKSSPKPVRREHVARDRVDLARRACPARTRRRAPASFASSTAS